MQSILDNIQNILDINGMNYQCSINDTDTLNDILYNYIDTQSDRNQVIQDLIKTNQANSNGISFTYNKQLNIKLDSQYVIDNLISINKVNDTYQLIVAPIFNIFYKGNSLLVNQSEITVTSGNSTIKFNNDVLFNDNLLDKLSKLSV